MNNSDPVDQLIAEVIDKIRLIDGSRVEKIPAFRKVVSEYLKNTPESAQSKTYALFHRIQKLHMRIFMQQWAVTGVEWDREWEETQKQWRVKQSQLVELLTEAADLFDSGQVAVTRSSIGIQGMACYRSISDYQLGLI